MRWDITRKSNVEHEELKPSKIWFSSIKHKVTIMDHDGWDRSTEEGFLYSWEQEMISETEFHKRLCQSTIIWDTAKL